MPSTYAYNGDVRKWGLFARAILKRPELIAHFVEKGLKQSEIEDVSTTEDTARQADNLQRDAEQKLSAIAPTLKEEQTFLLGFFSEIKLRAPNVVRDLQGAGDVVNAKALSQMSFSEKAIPRVPEQASEENKPVIRAVEVEEDGGEAGEEPQEEGGQPEDRESRAQKSVANAALRMAEYLQGKKMIIDAFIERKMPGNFVEVLQQKGDALMSLREERILLLEGQKKATQAEHNAVKAHVTARGVIEPTVSTLCAKEATIDALAVEYLGRKSAQKK